MHLERVAADHLDSPTLDTAAAVLRDVVAGGAAVATRHRRRGVARAIMLHLSGSGSRRV